MSIYKGGYILADISGTALTEDFQDLLPQDLKEYMQKYIVNEFYKKEILLKPIKLLIFGKYGDTILLTFNSLNDDNSYLLANFLSDTNSSIEEVIISSNLKIKEATIDI